jgi:hypothetical protein
MHCDPANSMGKTVKDLWARAASESKFGIVIITIFPFDSEYLPLRRYNWDEFKCI